MGSLTRSQRRLSTAPPAGPAAYMLPMVMGPHTVGKASQPSYSIKGRSKQGGFSDDLHKARIAQGARLTPPPAPDPTISSLLGVSHVPGPHPRAEEG